MCYIIAAVYLLPIMNDDHQNFPPSREPDSADLLRPGVEVRAIENLTAILERHINAFISANPDLPAVSPLSEAIGDPELPSVFLSVEIKLAKEGSQNTSSSDNARGTTVATVGECSDLDFIMYDLIIPPHCLDGINIAIDNAIHLFRVSHISEMVHDRSKIRGFFTRSVAVTKTYGDIKYELSVTITLQQN